MDRTGRRRPTPSHRQFPRRSWAPPGVSATSNGAQEMAIASSVSMTVRARALGVTPSKRSIPFARSHGHVRRAPQVLAGGSRRRARREAGLEGEGRAGRAARRWPSRPTARRSSRADGGHRAAVKRVPLGPRGAGPRARARGDCEEEGGTAKEAREARVTRPPRAGTARVRRGGGGRARASCALCRPSGRACRRASGASLRARSGRGTPSC